MSRTGISLLLMILFFSCKAIGSIVPGASQPEEYLPFLKNKKVGLVVNHTSTVGEIHLADFLLSEKIDVAKIFAPEHGFRGNKAAGEEFKNGVDPETGIPVVSLYGPNKKPDPGQIAGIDILVFDIQDVGCRFYTYISTLHYVIEACAENNIPLIILDRPNPNGDYVAGPVLEKKFSSFVGMDPIPVVHGCTVGELALMINGEKWHNAKQSCQITVIPVKNYSHKTRYPLPIKPSPNLPNDLAVRLYPSLCFFEATSVSIGRGTEFPFQAIGYPDKRFGEFSFTPETIPGVAIGPPQEGKACYGEDLRQLAEAPRFTLLFFLNYYRKFKNEADFLTRGNWFNLLAGTDKLIFQIREGKNLQEIEDSWQEGISAYKQLRKNYLLYPDFE